MPRLFQVALVLSGLAVGSCTAKQPPPPTAERGGLEEGVSAYEQGEYGTALRKLKPLADQGEGYAQYIIATMYYLGQEVPHDWSEAHRWYSLAAANLPAGKAREEATEHRDLTSKLVKTKESAEQGDPAAQAVVGGLYALGKGAPRDYTEAAKWFLRSADQGFAPAQFRLGEMYYFGIGVEQNHAEAAQWYRMSAEQGDADAQYSLAVMYSSGDGVPQDGEEALRWYLEAARKGHSKSIEMFREHAEEGSPNTQWLLGNMYRQGMGLPKDLPAAAKWHRRAAEQGFAVAQFDLGGMYAAGEGVPQDDAQAIGWWQLAAKQGLPEAYFNLGNSYASGRGVVQDYVRAHMYLNLAAAKGIPGAVRNRDLLTKNMTPDQVAEAQKLAREWQESLQ